MTVFVHFRDGSLRARARGRTAAYDPDQPREPAGTPEGGQFAGGGSGGSSEIQTVRGGYRGLAFGQFDEKTQRDIYVAVRDKVSDPPEAIRDRFADILDRAAKNDSWDEGMKWWGEAHDTAQSIADDNKGQTLEATAGALAAISVGSLWENEEEIVRAMLDLDERKVDLSDESLAALNAKFAGWGEDVTIENGQSFADLDARAAVVTMQMQYGDEGGRGWGLGENGYDGYEKGLTLLRGEGTPDELLAGPKVREMFNNIVAPDNPYSVVVDRFMYRAASGETNFSADSTVTGAPSRTFTVTNADGSTARQSSTIGPAPYIADTVAALADERGILPSQAQAIIWVQERKDEGIRGA